MANVRFYFGSSEKFHQLAEKNPVALYFLEDVQQIWKGDQLYASGTLASAIAAGLMSPEDKKKLDALAEGGSLANLQASDNTIMITNLDSGVGISVAISKQANNILQIMPDGLFVPSAPEYSIEKQEIAEEGYSVTYKLKKTENGVDSFVGDSINLAIDLVLEKAELKIVSEANVPYDGANVGDYYLSMSFNDADKTEIHVPMASLTDVVKAGTAITVVDNVVSVQVAPESHGLTATDSGLAMLLATEDNDGAMSKEDKKFLNSIPSTYVTSDFVKQTAQRVKYEVTSAPEGTLVDYREKEIRVMCPEGTQFVKQNVGATGNANMYYMGFKAYAPEGAVSFKEDDQMIIEDQTMYYFENNDFAGVDEFGRKYSILWLALATYDASSDSWTYFGKNSSADKYIGWYYTVEWYNVNGVIIEADQIRINLSNEGCYSNLKPSYLNEYATVEQVTKIEETLSWNEIVEF